MNSYSNFTSHKGGLTSALFCLNLKLILIKLQLSGLVSAFNSQMGSITDFKSLHFEFDKKKSKQCFLKTHEKDHTFIQGPWQFELKIIF